MDDVAPLTVGRVVSCLLLMLAGAAMMVAGGVVLLIAVIEHRHLGNTFEPLAVFGGMLVIAGLAVIVLGVRQGKPVRL